MGFSIKQDSGKISEWGISDTRYHTKWSVLGGPIIGFQFKGSSYNLSLIVGDVCQPKYFGARRLSMRLGEERELIFYWQQSDALYFSTCMTKGLFYIYDPEQLDWVKVGGNQHTAKINPGRQKLYSSKSYLSINYRDTTKVLKLSVFLLYS